MRIRRTALLLSILVTAFALSGCAFLSQLLRGSLQQPTARVTGARIESLSFTEVGLLFDLEVSNPNELEVRLAGFDYDLRLNRRPFVSGENQEGFDLPAGGSATIELPVTLAYREILDTLASIPEDRETPYALEVGCTFEVPGLGAVRVAAGREGTIPVIELPSLRLGRLSMEAVDFSGASMLLRLTVENPNGFGGRLRGVDFSFIVDESVWSSGELSGGYEIAPRSRREIELPIYVDFLALGSSARRLLRGEADVPYRLEGSAVIEPERELLGAREFGFDLSGTAQLR